MIGLKSIKSKSIKQLSGKWNTLVIINFMCLISIYFISFSSVKTTNRLINFILEILSIFIICITTKLGYKISRDAKKPFNYKIFKKKELINLFIYILINLVLIHIINIIFILIESTIWEVDISSRGFDILTVLSITLIKKTLFNFIILSIYLFSIIYVCLGFIFGYYIIFRNNKKINIIKIVNLSFNIIKGHRIEFLYFILPFTILAFMSIFTFGIGFLWLNSYYQVSKANYYKSLLSYKKEILEKKNRIIRTIEK
ncbi:DUF975 family protein [Peptostreptococcus equinus]|uniref:DUF975 family protein n=1 Tax=Peptostreptococcus equinus TaxID=3003601 RepID=A0ABY7JT67_9FIRM|nr:DUF975 family protein [Peptostreptococcus sp. CBA3647]WAW15165.1 DUF975 family protein [Peptostreptococcus sp. CBA3647]